MEAILGSKADITHANSNTCSMSSNQGWDSRTVTSSLGTIPVIVVEAFTALRAAAAMHANGEAAVGKVQKQAAAEILTDRDSLKISALFGAQMQIVKHPHVKTSF